MRFLLTLLVFTVISEFGYAQIITGSEAQDIDYNNPKEYEIGGITVTVTKYLDKRILTTISVLAVGYKITIQ